MKKILFSFIMFCAISTSYANDFSLENNYKNYNKTYEKTILENLLFSEKQLFKQTYKRDNLETRVERLELALFGAIQDGDEFVRVQNIKKSVTNVASNGYGLHYNFNKMMGLAGSSISNFSYGLKYPSYNNYYTRRNHPRYKHYHKAHHHPHCCSSHRIPPHTRYSSSIYPYGQQPSYTNGNFAQNYSLGTSVKILND